MQDTGKQIATNVVWKYLELFSVMGVQMVCTAIMARVLTPADYGVLGIALVFSSLAEVFVISSDSMGNRSRGRSTDQDIVMASIKAVLDSINKLLLIQRSN